MPDKGEGGMAYYSWETVKVQNPPWSPLTLFTVGQITLLMPEEMKVLVLYLAFSDTISVVEEDELDHLIAASKG